MFLRRLLYVLLGVAITLLLFIRFAIAPIAKNYLNKNGKELIGRDLSLEELEVNLFFGELAFDSLKVAGLNDNKDILSLDRFSIEIHLLDLLSRQINIDSLHLNGLTIRVEQNDKAFNFDDIIEHFNADSTVQEEPDTTLAPYRFRLQNFVVENSSLLYYDKKIDNHINIRDVDFALPDFRWDANNTAATLNFLLEDGGLFSIDAKYEKKTTAFDVGLVIKKMAMNNLGPYLQESLNIDAFDGTFNSDLRVKGTVNQVSKSKISGAIQLTDLLLTDKNKAPLIGLDNLRLKLTNIDLGTNSFELDSIQLDHPYINVTVNKDSTTNFSDLVKTTPQDTLATTKTKNDEKQPPAFDINHFVVNGIEFNFSDHSLDGNMKYLIDQFNITGNDLSSETNNWHFDLDGKLNKKGTITSSININPNDPLELNLVYDIKNFLMEDVNYYCHYNTGYPIYKGAMNYHADVVIHEKRLKSKHKMEIKYMEMGSKDIENPPVNLPIRFAVYLMKDEKERIKMKFPVKGEIGDPNFTFNKILWKVLRNTVVKVTSSPFKLLANTVSTDPQLLKDFSFAYGDTILTSKTIKTLNALTQVEVKKPELKIELVQYVDDTLETEAIAQNLAKKQYLIKKKGFSESNWQGPANKMDDKDEEFITYLRKKTKLESEDLSELCFALIGKQVAQTLQQEIRQKRMGAINQYIKSTAPKSKNISVRMGKPTNQRHIGSVPEFDVRYSIVE